MTPLAATRLLRDHGVEFCGDGLLGCWDVCEDRVELKTAIDASDASSLDAFIASVVDYNPDWIKPCFECAFTPPK